MTQLELLGIVTEKIQTSVEIASDVLEVILKVISEELLETGTVYIDDFGVFKTQMRSEYISLNNKTGEQFLMPPEIEITFESLLNYPGEANFDEAVSDTQEDLNSYGLLFEPDLILRNSVNSVFINFTPTLLNDGVELSGIELITDAQEVFEISTIEDVPVQEDVPAQENFPVEEDIYSVEDTLDSKTPVTYEIISDPNVPLAAELAVDPNHKGGPEIESVKQEQITSQVDTKVFTTIKGAPPIKQRNNNKILWSLVGGVAITLAALFFSNATSKRSSKSKYLSR